MRATLHYFLMEFVDGVTLRKLLDAGKLDPKEALAIVPQICDALQYAHDNGVVHRDIKPENILLDKRGRVKIADFGLAKLVGARPQDVTLTGVGQVMGTPHYMAPEQMEHPQEVDHRADIYSLGVVFYQMLTGELPLGPSPALEKSSVDMPLDEVVLRALEKEPEQRYQQASEIKTRVETILTTRRQESATGSAGVMSPTMRPSIRHNVKSKAQQSVYFMGPINCITIPMYVFFISGSLLPVDIKNPSPPPPIIQTLAVLAVFILIVIAPGIFTIFAALKMMRLKAYRLAVDASILTIIASPAFFFIGLPIGIWALVVLSQREVRAAFAKNRGANGSASGPRQVDSQHTDTPSSSTSKASGAPGQFGTPKRPWWCLKSHEVFSHMTAAERSSFGKHGAWFGIWNAVTLFSPMAIAFFTPIPVPLNWIIAASVLMIGLAFYPLWWKEQASSCVRLSGHGSKALIQLRFRCSRTVMLL